jgi:hypothetical protein
MKVIIYYSINRVVKIIYIVAYDMITLSKINLLLALTICLDLIGLKYLNSSKIDVSLHIHSIPFDLNRPLIVIANLST